MTSRGRILTSPGACFPWHCSFTACSQIFTEKEGPGLSTTRQKLIGRLAGRAGTVAEAQKPDGWLTDLEALAVAGGEDEVSPLGCKLLG